MDAPVPPNTSPMMLAHAAARAAAPGHLVLYRVGEFYEVLLDDATTVSRALGLQLTRRRQKDAADIPMCGIPAAAAGSAVTRLLAAGYKVALSEQPTDPAGARPLRLMTPGTSVDADVLTDGRPNNLTVALAEGEAVGFAWIDLSTGEAGTCMASLDGCGAALARVAPSEILVARWPEASDALAVAVRGSGAGFSDLSRPELPPDEADRILALAYGREGREGMRGFSPPELDALAALLDYVRAVVGQLPEGLPPPRRAPVGDTMEIDGPTLRGLEVLTSASGGTGRCCRCWTGRSPPRGPGSSSGSSAPRSPTPAPSAAGWRWCASSWPTPGSAATAASTCRACPTCCGPAVACPWAKAGRATSRPCATASSGPPPLRRGSAARTHRRRGW